MMCAQGLVWGSHPQLGCDQFYLETLDPKTQANFPKHGHVTHIPVLPS